MRTRISELLASLGLGGLSGMAILGALLWAFGGDAIETAADAVVERVCSASESERGVLRERVDRITAPHTIRVQCADSIPLETVE